MKKRLQKDGKSTAKIDDRLKEVQIPYAGIHIRDVFNSLNRSRQYGMSGPQPTSFSELKAFCELMDLSLLPWEITGVMRMDGAFLDEYYKSERE